MGISNVWKYFTTLPTPNVLIWMGSVVIAMSLITGFLVDEVTIITRHTVQTIGFDTKPSVEQAAKLRAGLAALYSDIANELLTGTKTGSTDDYLADIRRVSDSIVSADKNITYDDETLLLTNLQRSLAHLYALVGEIRTGTLDEQVHKLVYQSNIEHIMLLTSNLEKVNANPLNAAFQHFQQNTKFEAYGSMALFVVFLAVMVAIQFWITKKTKRLVNIPMAVATAIAFLSISWITYSILQERHDVRVAKIDSFNSLHVLYKIRAALYIMNADESMWLLDKTHTYQDTFFANAKKILDVDTNNDAAMKTLIQEMNQAVSIEKDGDDTAAKKAVPTLNGWIGDEIDNVTFGYEERKPATDATEFFIKYLQVDHQIRALETAGDHKGAIVLCIGNKENQSDWVFEHLIKSLDDTIQVNDDEFTEKINRAMHLLKIAPVVSIGSLVLIVLLTSFGLWQRYQEYT